MKKVLMIVASMREKSFNMQLARLAADALRGKAEVSFLNYANIPYMNQDIEFPTPEEILRVRGKVSKADGIWIFTPEYNYSYPGVLKNLLDWLSRPTKKGAPRNRNCDCGEKGHDQRCGREKRHSKRESEVKRTLTAYAGRSDGRVGDRCGSGWKLISDKCPEFV